MAEASHHFTSTEADWGFSQFFPLEDIANPNNGWLVDDTLIIKVSVEVQPDMRYSQDIRKETGFVGLKNQGATCYMNSLLQYLYNLPYFRTVSREHD
jgi:ubiquitin carboxyl-terminal hydrolase 7